MSSIDELPRPVAKSIIDQLGTKGLPPDPNLVPYYTVGIDGELATFENEYLGEEGNIGAPPTPGFHSARTYSFLVSARNGEGKTHFVYALLDRAYDLNYVASYVELDATNRSLNEDFEIYKAVISNVWLPDNGAVNSQERGFDKLLQKWIDDQRDFLSEQGKDSQQDVLSNIEALELDTQRVEFKRGVVAYLREYAKENYERAEHIYGWLKGELDPPDWEDGPSFSKLDSKNGDLYVASLTNAIRALGYQGTILVFDEAEAAVVPSEEALQQRSTRKKALDALFNFLKLVRNPGNLGIEYSLVLYCTTDTIEAIDLHPALRTAFLDPKIEFSPTNPSGSFINLGKKSSGPEAQPLFEELGQKLANIYWKAYGESRDVEKEYLYEISNWAAEAIIGQVEASGNMRRFVRAIIKAFHQATDEALSSQDVEDIVQDTSSAEYHDPDEGGLGE